MDSAIRAYERAFGEFVGTRYAFTFWKGRVAFYAILKALGIGPGDEVVLPGFTCVVVPNAVLYAGAAPVYADIEPLTFNLDPECLEAAITPRTRAVVVQHTFGVPAEMDALLSIARAHRLALIEDCAHALGSEYDGRRVGTFGGAAFFSSQWSKPYSTGLGGIAVTNDPDVGGRLAQTQESFAWPGNIETRKLALQVSIYKRFFSPRLYWSAMSTLRLLSRFGLFVGSSNREELECEKPVGYEKRMSPFQAAHGLVQLKSIQAHLEHRRRVVAQYERLLSRRNWPLQRRPTQTHPIYLRYPVLVNNKPALLEQARRIRVEIGSWFESVLHPAGSPLDKANYRSGQCPVAESIVERVVNLPTHPRVMMRDAERIVDFLTSSSEPCYPDTARISAHNNTAGTLSSRGPRETAL